MRCDRARWDGWDVILEWVNGRSAFAVTAANAKKFECVSRHQLTLSSDAASSLSALSTGANPTL